MRRVKPRPDPRAPHPAARVDKLALSRPQVRKIAFAAIVLAALTFLAGMASGYYETYPLRLLRQAKRAIVGVHPRSVNITQSPGVPIPVRGVDGRRYAWTLVLLSDNYFPHSRCLIDGCYPAPLAPKGS